MISTDNISVNMNSSIRIAGSQILYFDPYEIKEQKNDADVIFITHEHYDHFQPESILNIKKEGTILVAPESMKEKALKESGIPDEKCEFYRPGTVHKLGKLLIETIPAYNKIKPYHPKTKRWLGYLVKMDGVSYYVSGDTDSNEEIRKVNCDVALVPIGGQFTMGVKHAAELIQKMKPKAVVPTHYGSVAGKPTDGTDFKELLEGSGKDIQVDLKL